MEDDNSLDLTGFGKVAKAVPPKAWMRLVDTACSTFEKCIAPITSISSGVGRLIEAKFDNMVDAQKILAADAMKKATEKASKSVEYNNENSSSKVSVILTSLEHASIENNETIRELWSNLIAQELIDGSAHPEFPRILSRMSPDDARVLATIAEQSKKDFISKSARWLTRNLISLPKIIRNLDLELSYNYEHLSNLHLVTHEGGFWSLTSIGEAFIASVSDPSIESANTNA